MTSPTTTPSTPRFGTLGDFVEMIRTADNLGIRVLVDLVLNHTSDQHPWFQQARRDRSSRYRDYYRWSDEKQSEPSEVAFPGEQKSTWTYDEVAGQWYMHRYFDFMPELNITEPNVRDEMNKVLGFWLELGISGFRVDSLQFMIETVGTSGQDKPVSYLRRSSSSSNGAAAMPSSSARPTSARPSSSSTSSWTAATACRCCSTSAPAPRSGSRMPAAAPSR